MFFYAAITLGLRAELASLEQEAKQLKQNNIKLNRFALIFFL